MSSSSKLRAYYRLTKPGVLYGNVLTAIAGYFLASSGSLEAEPFFAMLIGMTATVASACAFNNYLDRDIDAKMSRTKSRPSVTGELTGTGMLTFASILLIIGMITLLLWTNMLVVVIGIIGFVTYVWLYGALSKRSSIHGTLVGSISGAMPIAGGYAAVSGSVDPGLIVVTLILFFWQFPEFFSIAIYRRKEYATANVPVLPVVMGKQAAVPRIFVYTVLYVVATLTLTPLGYTGWIYFWIMAAAGAYWIWLGFKGFTTNNIDQWAKKNFRFSMISILLLCLMLSIGPILP